LSRKLRIALVGNPNSGKSTVFNALTGLNQKVANFPGVTVDKRIGFTRLVADNGETVDAEIIDLPGIYSLYPKSLDEQIPFHILCDPNNELHPELTIIVADGTNLKRNLFLCSQIVDLKIPVILVINMLDIVKIKGMKIDFDRLSEKLGVPVVPMTARKSEGIEDLKKAILQPFNKPLHYFLNFRSYAPTVVDDIRKVINVNSDYNAFLVANNLDLISNFDLPEAKKEKIKRIDTDAGFDPKQMQAKETLERYKVISELMK